VDKFKPDESPDEYMVGALGIFEKDEEKLDCSDDGKLLANPPIPPAEPCM